MMKFKNWFTVLTLPIVLGLILFLREVIKKEQAVVSERDQLAYSEVAKDTQMSKWQLGLWFFKNWILERLASIAPVPSWRVALHRMRGIHIGKNVYIGYDVIFDRIYPHHIHIEDYVEIGDRSMISAHSRGSMLLRQAYERKIEPVHIKRGAWIMPGVIIIPGITIGEMSVIGTGAVVTKNIPPYSLAAGVPAKVIREIEKEKQTV